MEQRPRFSRMETNRRVRGASAYLRAVGIRHTNPQPRQVSRAIRETTRRDHAQVYYRDAWESKPSQLESVNVVEVL